MTLETTSQPMNNSTSWSKIFLEEKARAEVEALRLDLLKLMEDKSRQENINSLLTKVTK